MRQTIQCLQQARQMDKLCSKIFEVIHHKAIDKQYEPDKNERDAIYGLLQFLNCYQCPADKTLNASEVIDSTLNHEVEHALSTTCSNATQGARLLKNLLRFLVDDNLPDANLSIHELKQAKCALFDISLRANQLIEPESY